MFDFKYSSIWGMIRCRNPNGNRVEVWMRQRATKFLLPNAAVHPQRYRDSKGHRANFRKADPIWSSSPSSWPSYSAPMAEDGARKTYFSLDFFRSKIVFVLLGTMKDDFLQILFKCNRQTPLPTIKITKNSFPTVNIVPLGERTSSQFWKVRAQF